MDKEVDFAKGFFDFVGEVFELGVFREINDKRGHAVLTIDEFAHSVEHFVVLSADSDMGALSVESFDDSPSDGVFVGDVEDEAFFAF